MSSGGKGQREDEDTVMTDSDTPGNGEDHSPSLVDEGASPDDSQSGLEAVEPTLEGKLEALRRERNELEDALLRRRADFENYRRRVERDRNTAALEARSELFAELLGTVDNLERALSASGGEDELRTGVELTYRELVSFLESQGVVAVDPVGQRFDPAVQQALTHEPVPGLEEGEVAEVFRKGYSFGDRLLRPALVKVAKGEGSEESDDGDDGR